MKSKRSKDPKVNLVNTLFNDLEKQVQHTPTPWLSNFHIDEANDDSWKAQILANENRPAIAYTWGSDRKEVEANAAFIVRAVNAHEELLEVVKGYRAICKILNHSTDKLDRLIAKAEGK